MALNVGLLRSRIQTVFDRKLDNVGEIASQIAQAYQVYARSAQAPPGAPVILTGSESRIFEQSLSSLMRGRSPIPQAANSIGNAITGFWLAPPVKTGAGGSASAVVPQSGIAKLLSINVKDSSRAALTLAQSLDIMTRTVFIINPAPIPPGPLF